MRLLRVLAVDWDPPRHQSLPSGGPPSLQPRGILGNRQLIDTPSGLNILGRFSQIGGS
jgi:hypothetical protein